MAIKVEIINTIEAKINEHKRKFGTTKSWVANRIGVTRQSLNILFASKNPTIESLEKIAHVLKCDIKELYKSKITDE